MVQTRREKIREETLGEIKRLAREQMAAHGAAALSLRAIAGELGLTPPALYRYYKDRDALVTALILDAYNALADSIAAAVAQIPAKAVAERILAGSLMYREWAVANPNDFALIFGTPIPGYEAPSELTTPAAARTFQIFYDELENARRLGKLSLPPDYDSLPQPLNALIREGAEKYGYSPSSMHLTLVSWTRLHGMISLELFNHIQPLVGDPAQLYRAEVLGFMRHIGIAF